MTTSWALSSIRCVDQEADLRLAGLLAAGWEPFAVQQVDDEAYGKCDRYFLRKAATSDDLPELVAAKYPEAA